MLARILAIESSCDETAAAVIEDETHVLSSVVASQFPVHGKYGGVVPELASREHLRAIVPVVREALAIAGLTWRDLDAVAATAGPGLAGSLLVGLTYAKAIAFATGLPLIAVNHIEGHIHAVILEARQQGTPVEFPALALIVSGGHTHLFEIQEDGASRLLGRTRDDAAGEAFDKVAKLLGFGYPGGPVIDRLAPYGDPHAVRFQIAQIKHRDRNEIRNRVRSEASRSGAASANNEQNSRPRFDFSYSGIKTAVLRYVETEHLQPSIEQRGKGLRDIVNPTFDDYLRLCDRQTLNLVASFQRAMVTDLVTKALAAAREYDIRTLFVSGGVAAP